MLTDVQQADGRQLGYFNHGGFVATGACDRLRARWTSCRPGST